MLWYASLDPNASESKYGGRILNKCYWVIRRYT